MARPGRLTLPFTVRLTPTQAEKLEDLAGQVGRSSVDVVRWLIVRARVEDLPAGWLASADAELALRGSSEGTKRTQKHHDPPAVTADGS